MKNKTAMKILGLLMIATGLEVVIFGGADFRGFMIPDWAGYPILLGGLVSLVFGFVATKKQTGDELDYLVCSSCLHSVEPSSSASKQCPKCGGHLESLEGFYDRHPELKDSRKGEPEKLD